MKAGKGFCGCAIAVYFAFQLVACSATELEERCFPMMVGVGYKEQEVSYVAGFPRMGSAEEEEPLINEIQVSETKAKSFKESRDKYESHLNKEADYNHLKVLVLEARLLEKEAVYEQVLREMSNTEQYPRNTYVCAVEELEDLLKIEENLPQDLGTYLEEYLKNQDEKDFPTLGDMIDEVANQKIDIEVPFLKVKENYVEWSKNIFIKVNRSGK